MLAVALDIHKDVGIFGTDHPTPDGTGVRDYVHVRDLAAAHLLAMDKLASGDAGNTYNLGTESGSSVQEVLAAAREVTGHDIPAIAKEAREGDPALLVASRQRARDELGWEPERSDLSTILRDAWEWHRTHPSGHRTAGS